jgi:hypothetical protein
MKVHHVIGDGLAFLLALSSLQESYEPSQWVQSKTRFSKLKELTMTIAKPIAMLYAIYLIFM